MTAPRTRKVFDEHGAELTTADLQQEVSRRTEPVQIAVELYDRDGLAVIEAGLWLPPDMAATVAGVRILKPDASAPIEVPTVEVHP